MGYSDTDSAVSRSQFLRYAEDLAAVYDLERQRRTELKQVYEGISDIVHILNDGVLIANGNMSVREINQHACSLLNQNRPQVLGRQIQEVLLKAGATQHAAPALPADTARQGQVQTIHLATGRILRFTYSPMKNGWLFCMLRDATEEIRLESIKQDFFALLSHELRTPLTGILGFTELLMTHENKPPSLEAEALKNIHDSGMRMYKIVDELLRFASLQYERREEDQEPLQLSLLVSSVVDMLTPTAERKSISLFIDHDTDSPVIIRGNPGMISEMLRHVVQNSIIFGKQNGNVAIRIRPAANSTVTIAIEDDGIGIPSHHLSKVFESFYQVEDTLSRKYQGLGLGLSIARIIARIHQGSISIESEEGRGTTCTITLPASSAPQRKPAKAGVS